MIAAFENVVPHFIWKDKPSFAFGNLYAHDIGGLPEDDYTTGISFTPSGEAYHMEKWAGVIVLAPLIWAMQFILYDSVCGDVRRSPWSLLVMVMFAHTAPEGMLTGVVYVCSFGLVGILFAALSAAYAMPILGTLISGPEARRLPIRSRL